MSKYFLIASGGTGMRCLQSCIQLCALGMFPGKTLNILLVETDEENKDKRNTENLLKWYNQIKSNVGGSNDQNRSESDQPKTTQNRMVGDFFSANINLYNFVPDYSTDATRNFKVISQVQRGNSQINQELANIFYEKRVQEFDLSHGYRAQTHLGSYLMYHAIITETIKASKDSQYSSRSELRRFLQEIQESSGDGARIFVLGSTFGGTGASSIPIMTRAITHACQIMSDNILKMDNLFFGGVILSSYFSFPPPSANQVEKEKVVARSDFFEHNSASALMYYINDANVIKNYKRLYLLGWGGEGLNTMNVENYKRQFVNDSDDGKATTGGAKQENPGHVLELFSAFAAKHFFEESTTSSNALKNLTEAEFYYKTLEMGSSSGTLRPILRWEDLYSINISGNQKPIEEDIKDNFIGFLTLAALLNSTFENSISALFRSLKTYNLNYQIDDNTTESLQAFLAYFYQTPNNESRYNYSPGWFKQLYLTFHGDQGSPGRNFLNLSGELLTIGHKGEEWYRNFDSLQDNKKASDAIIKQLIKFHNKGNSPGKIGDFLKHFRRAIIEINSNK